MEGGSETPPYFSAGIRMFPRRAVGALQQFGGFRVVGDLLGLRIPREAAAGLVGDHRKLDGAR